MKYILPILFLLFLAGAANGQSSHVFIGSGIETSFRAGYDGPIGGLQTGAVVKKDQYRFMLAGEAIRAVKTSGGGHIISGSVKIRRYFSDRFFGDVRLGYSVLDTDDFRKPSTTLSIGGGAAFKKESLIISARYVLPDTTINGTSAFGFSVDYYRKLTKRNLLIFNYKADIIRYTQPGAGRRTGGFAGMSVAFGRRFGA